MDPLTALTAHEMDEMYAGVIGEVFDLRPRFGDEAKTHLLSIRLPETAHRIVTLILQLLPMTWGTQSDFGRDAFWYLAYFAYRKNQLHDKELASLLRISKAAGDAKYTANLRRQIRTHCDDFHDSLLDAFSDGNLEECHRQIEQFWDGISQIPNQWVREKFLSATEDSALLRTVVATLKRFGYRLDTTLVTMYT